MKIEWYLLLNQLSQLKDNLTPCLFKGQTSFNIHLDNFFI